MGIDFQRHRENKPERKRHLFHRTVRRKRRRAIRGNDGTVHHRHAGRACICGRTERHHRHCPPSHGLRAREPEADTRRPARHEPSHQQRRHVPRPPTTSGRAVLHPPPVPETQREFHRNEIFRLGLRHAPTHALPLPAGRGGQNMESHFGTDRYLHGQLHLPHARNVHASGTSRHGKHTVGSRRRMANHGRATFVEDLVGLRHLPHRPRWHSSTTSSNYTSPTSVRA